MGISPRQAHALGLVDKTTPKRHERTVSEQTFDASRIFDHEEIGRSYEIQHHNFIKDAGKNYLLIERELTSINQTLHNLTYDCNIAAWGSHDWNVKNAPTKRELNSVPDMLAQAAVLHPFWESKAKQAHVLRTFAGKLSDALEKARSAAFGDMHRRGEEDREKELRAEFEAQEKSEREARFQEWRASR